MDYAPPPAMKFPWRFVIYGAVVLYLFADLHLFHGPLRKHMESRRNPPPEATGPNRWVAAVNGKPILARELDRAVEIYLWKRGKSAGDMSGQNLTLVRLAVREELIARRLISTYARLNPVEFDTGLADTEYLRFRSRLDPAQDDFETRLELQSLTEKTLREQFHDEEHQIAWIDQKSASAREVSSGEIRAWFDENQTSFVLPERIRAAHIFLETHGLSETEITTRGRRLVDLKREIESGALEFDKAAAQISMDERTKEKGGDLGYFSRNRLPAGFSNAVFGQKVGALGEPFRSEIGWHLVRVDERLPARPAKFDEVAGEIRSYLESEKWRAVVAALVKERRGFARIQLLSLDEPPQ